jgi:hypothetical protein
MIRGETNLNGAAKYRSTIPLRVYLIIVVLPVAGKVPRISHLQFKQFYPLLTTETCSNI